MSAFVGRSREVERLLGRLDRTLSGRGGVVFITGDAGAGKSTLTERFLVEAALRAPEARILVASCSEQFGAGEPYQPFIEAFKALLTEGPSEPGSGSRFLDMAKRVAPYWLSVIPVAGNVLSAAVHTATEVRRSQLAGPSTEAPSEEALLFQYTELLLTAAEEAPVILFVDDLHWADRASASLFGHLARKIGERRVLMIGTFRPSDVELSQHPIRDVRAELLRYSLAEDLALEPLDEAALAEFIREELGGPGTPQLRRWLSARAGANPLFFGELLRWLVEQGFCTERDGEWALVRLPDQIDIPASAEGVIEKRLGRLDPELRRVLEYASVQGDEFDSTVLARLLEADELALEETLERLERVHRLLHLTGTRDLPDGDISSIYLFSHSLIQDVLHQGLQGKRRILLHRKVAAILGEIYAEDTSAVDNVLAVHFDEGRQPKEAYEAALRAAEKASRVYAHEDAVELLGRALRNAPGEPERAQALARRAAEWQRAGRFAEARSDLDEALGLARSNGDRALALHLRRRQADLEIEQGLRPAAELVAALSELAGEARELDDREELCQILWSARVLPAAEAESVGMPIGPALEEALDSAEALGEPELLARAHYCVGTGPARVLDPSTALVHLEEARSRYEALSNRLRVGYCSNALAVVAVLLGDYARARVEFERAEAAFEEVGDPVAVASARNNLGVLLTRVGEFERAEATLLSALSTIRRLGAGARELAALQSLAELHVATGDLARAEERWHELAAGAARAGYPDTEIVAACGMALVQLERGEIEAASASLETLAGRLEDGEASWTEGRESMLRLRARLALARDRPQEAAEAASEAVAALEGRDAYMRASFLLLRAEALAAAGSAPDAAEARRLAEEAREVFGRLEASPALERIDELITRLNGEV